MLSLRNTVANTLLTAIVAAADAGSAAAKIRIYSGTVPADADTALSGNTLLAQLSCSDPSGNVASKTLTFAPISDDVSIDATGTATFFRLLDSDDNVVIQGTVSTTAGGGDLKLSSVNFVTGGVAHIASASITLP